MPRFGQTGYSLPVLDRRRLARVLAALERRCGTQKQAAHELEITAVHFWRLRHGKGGESITGALFNRIGGLLTGDPRHTRLLYQSVASLETRPQRDAYRQWLRKALRRVVPGYPGGDINRARWVRLYGDHLPAYAGSHIKAFVRRLEKRHDAAHWNHRIWLAVAHVLTPLLATHETGGIERAWWELDDTNELGSYLNAALRAQEILLHREANVLRRLHGLAQQAEE